MTNHDTSIETYVQSLENGALRAELEPRLARMQVEYGFTTVGDIWGCLHPEPPGGERPSLVSRTGQLAEALHLSPEIARQLVSAIERVPRPTQSFAPAESEWYAGSYPAKRMRDTRDVKLLEAGDIFAATPLQGEPWFLSDLDNRLGPAWDQGKRGTCVAQAAGGLFSYVSGVKLSPQFLYHQCKMVDGHKDADGTWLRCAMKAFSDQGISGDSHHGWEEADVGVPLERDWPYNPLPAISNPSHTPPPERLLANLYSGHRWANTSGEVVRCSPDGRRLVDDLRSIMYHGKTPVAVSIKLFESFINANSRRTGWITLPLPGERIMPEGHAMLAVGFDDTLDVFVVRNSWGTTWACDNRYGRPGHAVIPYRYFEQYGGNAYAVRHACKIACNVEPPARLYNHPCSAQAEGMPAGSARQSGRTSRKGKSTQKSTPRRKSAATRKSTPEQKAATRRKAATHKTTPKQKSTAKPKGAAAQKSRPTQKGTPKQKGAANHKTTPKQKSTAKPKGDSILRRLLGL